MFLDDTACNLASLNLLQFKDATKATKKINIADYEHAVPPVDRRARNLGDDGAVPVEARSPNSPTNTARSASATPISAAC
jgi:ribonucleotide reductase alpha subunit